MKHILPTTELLSGSQGKMFGVVNEGHIPKSYREIHEHFIANHNGTTILENIFLIVPAPFTVFFSCCVSSLIRNYSCSYRNILLFVIELNYIVLSQILCLTCLSDFIVFVVLCLLVVYLFLLNSFLKIQTKDDVNRILTINTITSHRPYITYFRSLVNILTAVCILAVDFRIFPRRLAKTESFGFSLMDTGVGFFIITNAIVVKPKFISIGKKKLFIKTFLHNIPLIVLGFLRLLSVESVDYQKHVTEYGIHWNFFFTLAFVRIISLFIARLSPKNILFWAITIIFFHEFFLIMSLKQWVLDDTPRNNFFSANREGILSLPGYVSLYLVGLFLGEQLRREDSTIKSDLKQVINIFWAFIFLFLSTLLSYSFFDVSRRLINMTYVLWIITLSILFIGMLFVAEITLLVLFWSNGVGREYLIPDVLRAVNYNGLIFFLLANILTGLINMCIQTLNVSAAVSIGILTVYMTILCGVVSVLYKNGLKLKL